MNKQAHHPHSSVVLRCPLLIATHSASSAAVLCTRVRLFVDEFPSTKCSIHALFFQISALAHSSIAGKLRHSLSKFGKASKTQRNEPDCEKQKKMKHIDPKFFVGKHRKVHVD